MSVWYLCNSLLVRYIEVDSTLPSPIISQDFLRFPVSWRTPGPAKGAEAEPVEEDAAGRGALPAQSQEGEVGSTVFLFLLGFLFFFFFGSRVKVNS